MSVIPHFQGDDWDDMWHYPFCYLVLNRNCLIQCKILHKMYYTPARLTKIYNSDLADCWSCKYSLAGFLALPTNTELQGWSDSLKTLPLFRYR